MTTKSILLPGIFITAVLFLSTATASAQQTTKHLGLDEALAATLKNNKAVELAMLDEKIAAASYKETEAIFFPQVGLSYSALGTNNPLNAFGFKLQQKSIAQNDFDPAKLNDPSATSDFTTKLELQQPIINFDMQYKRKAAAKQVDLYNYKTQRTKEYLELEVNKAYLQLQLAYDAADVLEDANKTAGAVYTFTNNHYKQGLIQKSDLLNVQLRVTTIETNIAKAKSNIQNASDYLSLLMGVDSSLVYTVDKVQPETNEPAYSGKFNIPQNRADFIAMQRAIEASELMITATKKSYLPRLNAFGSYQFNDASPLGFGASAWMAGIQLTWDIFKGNKTKNSISTQKIQRDKLIEQLAQQKEQSQLELNKAYHDLSDAQFDARQQKAAIEQAAEALQILQNRYQQGLVNTTDVLMAATQVSQQKFALAQAVYAANVTKAWIQFLTSTKNK
ncbi:MAG: TolC family protein [Ferruginibacter sp.]|nr:TolC family protein [Ferruginibacter sp.]